MGDNRHLLAMPNRHWQSICHMKFAQQRVAQPPPKHHELTSMGWWASLGYQKNTSIHKHLSICRAWSQCSFKPLPKQRKAEVRKSFSENSRSLSHSDLSLHSHFPKLSVPIRASLLERREFVLGSGYLEGSHPFQPIHLDCCVLQPLRWHRVAVSVLERVLEDHDRKLKSSTHTSLPHQVLHCCHHRWLNILPEANVRQVWMDDGEFMRIHF